MQGDIENSEIIVKAHDLKLKIQKAVIQDMDILKNTPDIGYSSWLTASRIVDDIICEKRNRKEQKDQRVHRKKNFIDFILPKI